MFYWVLHPESTSQKVLNHIRGATGAMSTETRLEFLRHIISLVHMLGKMNIASHTATY